MMVEIYFDYEPPQGIMVTIHDGPKVYHELFAGYSQFNAWLRSEYWGVEPIMVTDENYSKLKQLGKVS